MSEWLKRVFYPGVLGSTSTGSTSEIIEADVCVVYAKRVEQVEDGLGHHRRTSSLTLVLTRLRDLVARIAFSNCATLSPQIKICGGPIE